MTADNFYPVAVHYRDAEMPSHSGRYLNVHGGDPRNYRTDFIHGVYRVGDNAVLEVALQISDFPSFCGGSFAHSPSVRVLRGGNSWQHEEGVVLPGQREPLTTDDLDSAIVDLREHYPVGADWLIIGHEILANAMIESLLRRGKRGIMLCGPTAQGEGVADFVRVCQSMTHVRRALGMGGDIRMDHHGAFNSAGLRNGRPVVIWPVTVDCQEVDPWTNYNSSRTVSWYPLVISSPCMGYESTISRIAHYVLDQLHDDASDAWDRLGSAERARWQDDRYLFIDSGAGSPGAWTDTLTQQEIQYLDVAHKFIRRFHWAN